MEDLRAAGLTQDEAFLIAVRRLGALDDVAREFARAHAERQWKQLLTTQRPEPVRRSALSVAIAAAIGAALSVRVPGLLGADERFFTLNVSLLVVSWLAGYFLWERRASRGVWLITGGLFAALAALVNAYPLPSGSAMTILVAVHLPVVVWFVMGFAYVDGEWRDQGRRMDFVRFTGEWVVYYVLLGLGGGALIALALVGFTAIGLDPESLLATWVLPCGAAGATVVAAWLVEAKQSVVENIAPVLTAVFTPLTTLLLTVYLVALLVAGDLVRADRDLLIVANVILVLVLGLVLYAISARDPARAPDWFDRMQMVLIVLALVIDLLMLVAMSGRILTFGVTANKAAALGLNLLLLANLIGAAWIGIGFLRAKRRFAAVEGWQTAYLPLFGIWASVVALVFPAVFAA